jgi:prophage maintenance system killer protein
MSNKTSKKMLENVIIYQAKNGAIELQADTAQETMWASINQIADLFGVQKASVSKHIKNIFATGELRSKATVSKMETVQKEGTRTVTRKIEMYNLDMIIAVGYRVNSKKATQFRMWATSTLREYVMKGYVLNRQKISQNYKVFMKSVNDVQLLLPEHVTLDPKAILELIKEFSSTWMSLDAYDKETLKSVGVVKKAVTVNGDELMKDIARLRAELIRTGGASDIFAQERTRGSVEGIIGNVMQSFSGKAVYATAEEKSANLLYFMVKNHPFVDGNKRSGAFAFLWFLRKTKVKGVRSINPNALTALTLLIAESDPKKKEQVVALVTHMLR